MRITQKQIDTIRHEMEAELVKLVNETREEMRPEHKASYEDVADASGEAVADTLVDTENAIIGIHLEKARDINAALDRIKKGVYGVCIDCEEDIDTKRLAAYSTAKRCINCQNQHNKIYANERTSSL